jgi:hypothetical protein
VANRLFAVQPPGTRWPFPWPAGFPPRWAALPGGAAPAVNGLSSAVTCALSAQQPRCGLQQLPVGDGFDGGMSFGSAIGVEAGRGYTFRAVVRATGTAGGAGLVLSVALAPGVFAANLTVPDTTATAAWTELAFSFIAGATTARAENAKWRGVRPRCLERQLGSALCASSVLITSTKSKLVASINGNVSW